MPPLVSASTQSVTPSQQARSRYATRSRSPTRSRLPSGNPFTTTANHYLTTGGRLPAHQNGRQFGVDTSTTVLTSFNGPKKPGRQACRSIHRPADGQEFNTRHDARDSDRRRRRCTGGIVLRTTPPRSSLAIASGPTGRRDVGARLPSKPVQGNGDVLIVFAGSSASWANTRSKPPSQLADSRHHAGSSIAVTSNQHRH